MRFEQNQSSMGGLTTVNGEIVNDLISASLTGSLDETVCFYSKVSSSQHSGVTWSSLSSLFLWSFNALPSYVGVEDCPDDEESRSCDKWHAIGSGTNQKVEKTYWTQTKSRKLVQAEAKVK